MPRRLRNAVLRLLRPAEAAARRLVIALARGLAAPPSAPSRPRKKALPKIIRNGVGAGILWPPGMRPKTTPHPARLLLPLFDPPPRFRPRRSRGVPSISLPGDTRRVAMPPMASPRDMVSAARLHLRLQALAAALDDLPGQARRFARLRRRSTRRRWPLRPGPPRGLRRRRSHEVYGVLASAHELAFFALQNPDTS